MFPQTVFDVVLMTLIFSIPSSPPSLLFPPSSPKNLDGAEPMHTGGSGAEDVQGHGSRATAGVDVQMEEVGPGRAAAAVVGVEGVGISSEPDERSALMEMLVQLEKGLQVCGEREDASRAGGRGGRNRRALGGCLALQAPDLTPQNQAIGWAIDLDSRRGLEHLRRAQLRLCRSCCVFLYLCLRPCRSP